MAGNVGEVMNGHQPNGGANSNWGRLGLAAGAVACVLPIPLFALKVPELPALEQGVLMGVFIASMATCSLVGSRRPLLGLLVLPVCFFGLACLACWWVASTR